MKAITAATMSTHGTVGMDWIPVHQYACAYCGGCWWCGCRCDCTPGSAEESKVVSAFGLDRRSRLSRNDGLSRESSMVWAALRAIALSQASILLWTTVKPALLGRGLTLNRLLNQASVNR